MAQGIHGSKTTAEVVAENLGELDRAIFERLPDEGAKLGYHPMIKSARRLLSELNAAVPQEAQLRMGEVNGRLRALYHLGGYVKPVSTGLTGRIDGWQRTAKAMEWMQSQDTEAKGGEG